MSQQPEMYHPPSRPAVRRSFFVAWLTLLWFGASVAVAAWLVLGLVAEIGSGLIRSLAEAESQNPSNAGTDHPYLFALRIIAPIAVVVLVLATVSLGLLRLNEGIAAWHPLVQALTSVGIGWLVAGGTFVAWLPPLMRWLY